MSQPTDASDTDLPEEEGLKWTVESGSGNKTEYHPRRESFAAPPPSDAERAEVEALNARVAQLSEEVEQLSAALSWVVPMAKGYAHEHPVGKNYEIARAAEERMRNANAALSGTGTDRQKGNL